MEYISDINIIDSAIHILENDGTSPILNNDKLILDDETYKFVYKNVEKSIKDDLIQYANFSRAAEAEELESLFDSFFDGKKSLVDISKELSSKMYEIMRGNNLIPSCDLLFTHITTDIGQMLGIIKLDFVSMFNNSVKDSTIEIVQGQGLPVGAKIQKAVFIRPDRKEDEFRVLILDKRTKSKDEDFGANYFINDFMHIKTFKNERDISKEFYSKIEDYIADNKEIGDLQKIEAKSKLKDALLEGGSLEIAEFVEDLKIPGADEIIEEFENLELEEIKIDSTWAEKKLKKTTVTADKDIKITLPQNIYNDSSKFEIKKNSDGSFNVIIKFIDKIQTK